MADVVYIDVREPFEFKMGHVKGALNIPPMKLLRGAANELEDLPRDTPLVVYCRTGSRSSASIPYIRQMGFTNITNGINQARVEANKR